MPERLQPRLVLTWDVEEFDLPLEYGMRLSLDEQLAIGNEGMSRVAAWMLKHGITSTLFITGVYAQAFPEQMRSLAERHEIASHGFSHTTFETGDLAKSREVLQRITGQAVRGFRRARFARTCLRAIREAGYNYDSSENPIWLPGRYNHFFHPRLPRKEGDLWRIPVSASPIVRFPLFWLSFKNCPLALFRRMAEWTLAHDGVLHLIAHPWECAELNSFNKIPSWIRRPCGAAYLERLEHLLLPLARTARWGTVGEIAS